MFSKFYFILITIFSSYKKAIWTNQYICVNTQNMICINRCISDIQAEYILKYNSFKFHLFHSQNDNKTSSVHFFKVFSANLISLLSRLADIQSLRLGLGKIISVSR